MHIVILDSYVTNPGDISWDPIKAIGELTLYDRTPDHLVVERSKDAEIVLVNKTVLTSDHIQALPNLQLICIMATGMDNVAVDYAKSKGIEVKNAKGYSTRAVAQHVFALILELTNHVGLHNQSVQDLEWTHNVDWCYWKKGLTELSGKTIGIYGLGEIGKAVIRIAESFGMRIAVTSGHARAEDYPNWQLVPLDELFEISDIVSLHAPLSSKNEGVVDEALLRKMRPESLLINTGRGGLIVNEDLRKALIKRQLAGAAMDVLSSEPPEKDHPLLGIDNCILTPHIAWAAKESRLRLVEIVESNILNFQKN